MSIVKQMIICFFSLALLLVVISVLTYQGLKDISTSAELVAEEKMPIQRAVAELNEVVLHVARMTTNAYFVNNKSDLLSYKSEFDDLVEIFDTKVKHLSSLVKSSENLNDIKQNSEAFVQASESMFISKQSMLETNAQILEVSARSLAFTDEASALMLDLSYLESDSQDLNSLIGMSTNIDNKLGLMLTNIKTLTKENDEDIISQTIDDLEYQISNVIVDVDYAKRLANNIDDGGIFESFDTEFAKAQGELKSSQGLFALKNSVINLKKASAEQRSQADLAINNAIVNLQSMSEQVNQDALLSQQNILSTVKSNINQSILVSIIGILSTSVLAFLTTRSIAKPLGRINKKLSILSNGDLSKTLDDSGSNEFAVLSRNVNQLIYSLRKLITSITEKEHKLREVAMESIEAGDKSLHQVAMQREQIDVTSQNTQKVKQTSASNVQLIHQADTKIEDAISQSERVEQLVKQSVLQVNEQLELARQSTDVVNSLGENSHKIGNILDVIKTIAEQTNLLALNAAIEAARAGEQGRGFAVVADEVRTLATRTQNSTEEIEKMIMSLQQDAKHAVTAMDQGAQQAQKSVEVIHQVNSEVNEIKNLIKSLASVNANIVQDTKSQDSLLDDVVNRLDTIVELSKESAISTQASNDASHNIEIQMDALKQAVGQFTLN